MYETDVFISYKREEPAVPTELKSRLEAKGYKVWMDVEIGFGEKWRAKIDKYLQNTMLVIVITSPASMASAYVTYEWTYGCLSLGKEFYWVQIAHCDKDKGMFGLLMDNHQLPFEVSSTTPPENEWEKLVEDIENRHLKGLKRIREAGEILSDTHRGEFVQAAIDLGKVTNPYHIPLARQMLLRGLKTHTYTSGEASRPIAQALNNPNISDLSAIPYLINFLKETHEPDIDNTAKTLLDRLIGQNS